MKPNRFELANLCGCEPDDEIACVDGAMRLVADGIEHVMLSLGAYGAIYLGKDFALRAAGLKVPVVGRSGAGDAMMAALVLGLIRGLNPEDRLRYAVAAASAKIMVPGTQPPEEQQVQALLDKVIVKSMA